jgi:hypothetical protein
MRLESLGIGLETPGIRFQSLAIEHETPEIGLQSLEIEHKTLGIGLQTPGIGLKKGCRKPPRKVLYGRLVSEFTG